MNSDRNRDFFENRRRALAGGDDLAPRYHAVTDDGGGRAPALTARERAIIDRMRPGGPGARKRAERGARIDRVLQKLDPRWG